MGSWAMSKNVGDVIEVPLPSGGFAYAKLLDAPLVAFYDCFSDFGLQLEEVVQAPTAFKIWVMQDVVRARKWKKIGTTDLTLEDLRELKFFSRDAVSKQLIIHAGHNIQPGTMENCTGLEVAAVWTKPAIEERLEYHRRGEKSPLLSRHSAMLSGD